MLLGAMALASFTACDDAPAEPPMQSNPEEPVLAAGNIVTTESSFLQNPPAVVNLQDYVDNSLITVINRSKVENLPAGAEVKYYMELSPVADFSQQMHTLNIEFLDTDEGFVDAQRWSSAQIAMFGKNPEKVRHIYYRIPVYVALDGTEYRYESTDYYVGTGELDVRCIDTGFVIYPEYYLLSHATTWQLPAAAAFKFKHSDKDVYDDPVFTYLVEVGENCYWKIASTKTLATQDWSTIYGPADDGDQNFVGKLVENGGAGCIAEAGKYLFTINMESLDYTIEPFNRPEYLCTPNKANGWNQGNSNWMRYFEKIDNDVVVDAYFYGLVRIDPGDGGFKLTDGATWADDKTWGYGGEEGTLKKAPSDNIPVPTKGAYWLIANLEELTYKAVLVESLGVIGGGDWNTQRDLTPNEDFTVFEGDVEINGDWKIRINNDWGYNFGGDLLDPSFEGGNFTEGSGNCHVAVSLAGNWPVITVTPL